MRLPPSGSWPNLFIVGAPKAGTTALYAYLKQHPGVFMSGVKEPRFFAPDLDSGEERDAKHFVRTPEEYLALFREGTKSAVRGEATSLYLYSETAAQRIGETCPDARVIVMLRDPVDLVHAFHGQRLFNGNEDVVDFAEALALEGVRARGHRVPEGGAIAKALQYRQLGKLGTQVRRYVEAFDPARIHVIRFEDLVADTPAVFRNALRFLGVDDSFTPEFPVMNRRRRIRSSAVHRTMSGSRNPVRRVARSVVPARLRARVWQLARRLNSRAEARPSLDPELRIRLRAEFAPEVGMLEELLGLDLGAWR